MKRGFIRKWQDSLNLKRHLDQQMLRAFEFNKQSKRLQMKLILINMRRVMHQEKKWLVKSKVQLQGSVLQRIITEWYLEVKRGKCQKRLELLRMRSVLKALKEVPCTERKEVARHTDSVAARKVLRALLDYRELS